MTRAAASAGLPAALALGGSLLAATAFVAPSSAPSTPDVQPVLLRGSAATPSAPTPGSLLLVAGGALCAAAAAGRSTRVVRRAEPISAAAAAAAAAKVAGAAKAAAAAKGATETAAAVTGAAGAGSLTKGGKEGVAGTATPDAQFDPATAVGATAPLGFFDPAGFSKKGDQSGFRNLRAAEIKHGRVAMMAALGAVAQHFVKLPGFEAVPSGLAAATAAPGSYGFIALFAVSGALELGLWAESSSKEPGNFGDPLGLNQYTVDMRNRELNNGRMAMFAAIGIIASELLTGKDGIEQLGL